MLDWDDFRYFLALARHGTLVDAAKEMRVSQPTVSRRLASLESHLGVRLLNRTPDGYIMTLAGREVRDRAEKLEAEAMFLERAVGGRDTRLAGRVRLTCAETMAARVLAPCLASLSEHHPEIEIDLAPDTRDVSLAMREAEISVRLSSPGQHDLVARRAGSLGFGLYASQIYLDRYGSPDFDEECFGHRLIAQVDDIEDKLQFDWLAQSTARARPTFRTSSHETAVVAAVNGIGLACLARLRGDQEKDLTRIETPREIPSSGIWLVVHKDNRDTPRIRLVMNHLTKAFKNMRISLDPDAKLSTQASSHDEQPRVAIK